MAPGRVVMCRSRSSPSPRPTRPAMTTARPPDGQDVFRHDTFGDEAFWTDHLKMNAVIEQAVDPVTALSLGLKVDADALPDGLLGSLTPAQLADPQTTLALLKLDAVVGRQGHGRGGRRRQAPPHPRRHHLRPVPLDRGQLGRGRHRPPARRVAEPRPRPRGDHRHLPGGPATRRRSVYRSWGPGRYDPRFNIDGLSTPLVIPPAYGLAGVRLATYTGDGDISYWNDYVAVTQMGGQGVFIDRRIGVKVVRTPDLVHPVLKPLREYQLELEAPAPPAGSFDPVGRDRRQGRVPRGRPVRHLPQRRPLHGRQPPAVLHAPAETGMDPAYAQRSATGKYRTTPLRALVAACPVLPRRQRQDAGRRGRTLRRHAPPPPHRPPEGGPGRVPEVDLTSTRHRWRGNSDRPGRERWPKRRRRRSAPGRWSGTRNGGLRPVSLALSFARVRSCTMIDTVATNPRTAAARVSAPAARPAYQAFLILYAGFIALPIIAGPDKFLHLLVNWDNYLAPAVANLLPVSGHTFMLVVGVIEIAAGVLVFLRPRVGAVVVALWLWGIIVNLLLAGGYYDVALRNFGLSLGALALARPRRGVGSPAAGRLRSAAMKIGWPGGLLQEPARLESGADGSGPRGRLPRSPYTCPCPPVAPRTGRLASVRPGETGMPASSLRERHLQAEIMDRPGLDPGEHHQALDAIARINLISASSHHPVAADPRSLPGAPAGRQHPPGPRAGRRHRRRRRAGRLWRRARRRDSPWRWPAATSARWRSSTPGRRPPG